MKKTARSYRPIRWIAGLLALASLAALLRMTPLQDSETGWGLHALYALRGARPTPKTVSVIAINAAAADRLGLPQRADRWPRSLHAELIDGLRRQGAAVIAFDLLFDQPRDANDDRRLAESMRRAGNVVLVEYLRRELIQAGALQGAIDRLNPPIPLLEQAALATAPFVLPKTNQGVLDYLAFAPEGDDVPAMP